MLYPVNSYKDTVHVQFTINFKFTLGFANSGKTCSFCSLITLIKICFTEFQEYPVRNM